MPKLTDFLNIREAQNLLDDQHIPRPHFIKFIGTDGKEYELNMETEYPQAVLDLIPSDMLYT